MPNGQMPGLIRLITQAPPGVSSAERPVYATVIVGCALAFLYHAALTVFWYLLGVREMVAYHYIGLPWLVACTIIAKKGRSQLALFLVTLEYAAHAVLGTYYIGWNSGMHFPVPMPALAWSIVPARGNPKSRIIPLAVALLYVVMAAVFPGSEPRYAIEPQILRYSSIVMASTFLGILSVLFVYNSIATGWLESLERERTRSEKLLLNILPEKIAERLKDREEVIADRFDSASVLFLDIVDFTILSANMAAHKVVTLLDDLFCRFDALADRHGLEKIKTIGDAYMAVAGIPEPVPDHARRIAEMAIDMLDTLEAFSAEQGRRIEARIGICSGPVVAGVIGRRKFIYDLWGDTVNTASRMESHGIANRIQVTESSYAILRDDYELEPRGEICVKGKGQMRTFFLVRRRQDGRAGD